MTVRMAKLRVNRFILSDWILQFKPFQPRISYEYKSYNSRLNSL
jgi:hypothetical protein